MVSRNDPPSPSVDDGAGHSCQGQDNGGCRTARDFR